MKKYSIIYADPPWQFNNKKTGGSTKSGAASQYRVTSIEDLKRLDVASIAADDAILIMWYVGAMPQEALDLVKSWGFTLKNMNGFVWNKLTKNHKPFLMQVVVRSALKNAKIFFFLSSGSVSIAGSHKGRYSTEHKDIKLLSTTLCGGFCFCIVN